MFACNTELLIKTTLTFLATFCRSLINLILNKRSPIWDGRETQEQFSMVLSWKCEKFHISKELNKKPANYEERQ